MQFFKVDKRRVENPGQVTELVTAKIGQAVGKILFLQRHDTTLKLTQRAKYRARHNQTQRQRNQQTDQTQCEEQPELCSDLLFNIIHREKTEQIQSPQVIAFKAHEQVSTTFPVAEGDFGAGHLAQSVGKTHQVCMFSD